MSSTLDVTVVIFTGPEPVLVTVWVAVDLVPICVAGWSVVVMDNPGGAATTVAVTESGVTAVVNIFEVTTRSDALTMLVTTSIVQDSPGGMLRNDPPAREQTAVLDVKGGVTLPCFIVICVDDTTKGSVPVDAILRLQVTAVPTPALFGHVKAWVPAIAAPAIPEPVKATL
jgi:hypothetical protein